MRNFFSVIILLLSAVLSAQQSAVSSRVDKIALQIPDSLTSGTSGIAQFINSNFSSQKDKARAIFVWITNNIRYDIDNMFAVNFYQNSDEIVSEVLKSKKGVCMHFAELFSDIANKAGISSFVIPGYTKQNGFVDYIPHSWCIAKIDSVWCIFDPTWGSGYVQNAKFIRKMNDFYFMSNPQQLIKSHIPFDPMWELLNYPVTNQEFYEGKVQIDKNKPFFSFNDSIDKYISESEIRKLISSSRRIEKNGVRNSMIFDRLQHNKREIEYYENKKTVDMQNAAVDDYNEGVTLFNDGINQLNSFIDYRNHQFLPKKNDQEIQKMLDDPELKFNATREKLKNINTSDKNLTITISQLNRSLDEAFLNLNEQKVFLNKYFSTGKLFRKSLFYRYTWKGISSGK